MKIRNITAILAAAVASTSFAGAQELSVSTTVAWESEYIFRGVRLADEFAAPSVDVSYGDFYAGLWAALPFESPKHDWDIDSEVDLYGGYSFGLNETISADVGATYYTYYSTPGAEDTVELYAGLSFEVPLSPAVYVFYDFDLEAFTAEASAGYTFEINDSNSVELSGYAGYVEPDEGDSWLYYGAGAAYSYAFTEKASAKIGVNYYGTDADYGLEADGSKSKFTLAASVTTGF